MKYWKYLILLTTSVNFFKLLLHSRPGVGNNFRLRATWGFCVKYAFSKLKLEIGTFASRADVGRGPCVAPPVPDLVRFKLEKKVDTWFNLLLPGLYHNVHVYYKFLILFYMIKKAAKCVRT